MCYYKNSFSCLQNLRSSAAVFSQFACAKKKVKVLLVLLSFTFFYFLLLIRKGNAFRTTYLGISHDLFGKLCTTYLGISHDLNI